MKNKEVENVDTLELYFKEIKEIPLLTKEEEYQLFEEYRKGNKEAKEKLIESNLRLVAKIASEYKDRGLEYLDLIQEGSIGLIKAVEKFDHTEGYRLSTYATYKISRCIKKAINDKARIIRIPTNKLDKINRFICTKNKLEEQFGRTMSIKELQDHFNLTKKEVTEYLIISNHTVSLNQELNKEEWGFGEKGEIIDSVTSEEKPFEDEVMDKMILEEVKEALVKLTPIERKVLAKKLGFLNEKPEKLIEISKQVNRTRKGTKIIYDRSIEKLRKYIHEEEQRKVYIRRNSR